VFVLLPLFQLFNWSELAEGSWNWCAVTYRVVIYARCTRCLCNCGFRIFLYTKCRAFLCRTTLWPCVGHLVDILLSGNWIASREIHKSPHPYVSRDRSGDLDMIYNRLWLCSSPNKLGSDWTAGRWWVRISAVTRRLQRTVRADAGAWRHFRLRGWTWTACYELQIL
jgi:hypothetical protein